MPAEAGIQCSELKRLDSRVRGTDEINSLTAGEFLPAVRVMISRNFSDSFDGKFVDRSSTIAELTQNCGSLFS